MIIPGLPEFSIDLYAFHSVGKFDSIRDRYRACLKFCREFLYLRTNLVTGFQDVHAQNSSGVTLSNIDSAEIEISASNPSGGETTGCLLQPLLLLFLELFREGLEVFLSVSRTNACAPSAHSKSRYRAVASM